MNKYALGTVVGTALLSLAKKGSLGSIRIDDFIKKTMKQDWIKVDLTLNYRYTLDLGKGGNEQKLYGQIRLDESLDLLREN